MTGVAAEDRVVVVGGGLAGGRTCAALRQAGFAGEILLVSGERHDPYDRPVLSKGFLDGGVDPCLGIAFDELRVEVMRGVRADGVDVEARTVSTGAGTVAYDWLVLATGSEPVRLPGDGPQFTLRTVEDAEGIKAALVPGARIVVVGAGWIGAEVATAALSFGCSVVCLEADRHPLAAPLGEEVGARLVTWWHGADLRTGVRVASVDVGGVRLESGEIVPADLVLTAVGVRADTAWLASAGLKIDAGGVAVDHDRRTSDARVFAIGDVASRWSDRFAGRVHSGHWDEAVTGATAVAAAIVGAPQGVDDVPYFWSDQFGRKIQYVGQHTATDTVVVREHPDDDRWGAAWLDQEGRLTAHLSVSFPRAMVRARAAIAEGRVVAAADLTDLTHLIWDEAGMSRRTSTEAGGDRP